MLRNLVTSPIVDCKHFAVCGKYTAVLIMVAYIKFLSKDAVFEPSCVPLNPQLLSLSVL